MPQESPATFQRGLVEREINEILYGNLTPLTPQCNANKNGTDQSDCVLQRVISTDDICPICQGKFFAKRQMSITYCRHGCGQNVHVKCMKIWADHQIASTESSTICCPLCREEFCSYKVNDECQNTNTAEKDLFPVCRYKETS